MARLTLDPETGAFDLTYPERREKFPAGCQGNKKQWAGKLCSVRSAGGPSQDGHTRVQNGNCGEFAML